MIDANFNPRELRAFAGVEKESVEDLVILSKDARGRNTSRNIADAISTHFGFSVPVHVLADQYDQHLYKCSYKMRGLVALVSRRRVKVWDTPKDVYDLLKSNFPRVSTGPINFNGYTPEN